MVTATAIELRKAIRAEQRPVAFVGSGLSTNYPAWPQFVRALAGATGTTRIQRALRTSSRILEDPEAMLAIIDECFENFEGEASIAEFFRSTFAHSVSPRPSVYDALVRAPFAFFITTNYDCNIEEAYRQNYGTELQVVLGTSAEEALRLMRVKQPFVFKVHGCAIRGGPYVAGSESYLDIIYNSRSIQAVLNTLFSTYTTVFVGYGHRDPHISNYLALQKQVLRKGRPPHFTFVRRTNSTYDTAAYYRHKYGIVSVEIDDWHELEDTLNELTFLQVRDQYDRVRREQAQAYRDFVKNRSVDAAWGAILYAQASMDIGRNDECFALWKHVQDNPIVRDKIETNPSLALTINVVSGVMLKRVGRADDAAREFANAVLLTEKNPNISAPLRSVALRYAGHFFMWTPDLKYRDQKRARELFRRSKQALGASFHEEGLDLRRTLAMVASQSKPATGISLLLELATQADSAGYKKSAGWCRFNAARLLHERKPRRVAVNKRDLLARAISDFEDISHFQGLSQCFLLQAKLELEDGRRDEALSHAERARALAVIGGNKLLTSQCDTWLASI